MMAARPRCGEAKKVAKGTGIMALTANARLPRNKKSGLQFLIAAKDRGFPQRGGVSGHLRPRIGLTGGSNNDEFGSICWADKTHFPAAYPTSIDSYCQAAWARKGSHTIRRYFCYSHEEG